MWKKKFQSEMFARRSTVKQWTSHTRHGTPHSKVSKASGCRMRHKQAQSLPLHDSVSATCSSVQHSVSNKNLSKNKCAWLMRIAVTILNHQKIRSKKGVNVGTSKKYPMGVFDVCLLLEFPTSMCSVHSKNDKTRIIASICNLLIALEK